MADILAGVRVVEVGQVLAGPYVGAMFADLGADVIKVERADGGDDARHMGPAFRHDDALTFHSSASLLETALMRCGQEVDALVNTGAMPPRHRTRHPDLVPYEAFEAADGPFAKMAEVLGRPDWIADPRYAGSRGRLVNGERPGFAHGALGQDNAALGIPK